MRRMMSLLFLLVLLCVPHGTASAATCSECHPYALCEEHADYVQCVCKDGFVGDGFNCSDIDECAYKWTHNCSVGTCQNTLGSYTCLCPSGFIFSGGSCVPIREYDRPRLGRVDPIEPVCSYATTGFSCVCPNGYYINESNCEFDECQRSDCGLGTGCTSSPGSYSCSDPCVTRTVLNEPWRSTSNTELSWNCDFLKNGWYQFKGSGGVRIPESCVPQYRCNTNAPLWMNGTHPVIADGVVNRTVCASYDGSCCQSTSTIQVKACPLGYYVYKITGTPESKCHLSYCTVEEVCAADEEWKTGDKGDRCYCKDQYKVSSLSDIRPELTCGANEMRASFQKCQMKELNTNLSQENIKNGDCFSFEDDNVTNTFSVLASLKAGGCGVQSSQNESHITYRSTISIDFHKGVIITKNDTLNITVSCAYKLDMITSLNLALKPIISSVDIAIGGTGQFQAIMALYKDSSYSIPYEGSEVSLPLESILYIGVFIQGADISQYALVMRNCYATPTQSANDTLKYYIIKDSCPNKEGEGINVLENGVSVEGRISVQMFKFVGDYDLVYLHCAVSLCEVKSGACQPTCTSRSQRSELDSYNLKIGPIIRSDIIDSAISSSHSFWALLPTALLLLIASM